MENLVEAEPVWSEDVSRYGPNPFDIAFEEDYWSQLGKAQLQSFEPRKFKIKQIVFWRERLQLESRQRQDKLGVAVWKPRLFCCRVQETAHVENKLLHSI